MPIIPTIPYTLYPKTYLKGFTLIELLVVVAIIALLMTIAISSYNQLQITARDAEREADLGVIRSNLEQYKADLSYYPVDITFGSDLSYTGGVPPKTTTYLKTIPNDPARDVSDSQSPYYEYVAYDREGYECTVSDPKCVKYCLYALMESSENALDDSSCQPVHCQISGVNCNYELTPP